MQGKNAISVGQWSHPIGVGAQEKADALSKFLGDPVAPINPTSYDKTSYTNYDLPEAYKGKNLFLQDTITGLILEDNEWYTVVCLPWAFTDQLHVQWNQWHFNTTLADRVPHEGISRLIKSSKRHFRGHVVRRGLGFMMEADFWRTPEGQEHYRRNLIGISQSVQETQNHDTIHALLTCKNYHRMWEERFGKSVINIMTILEEEIKNYASVVQDEKRIEIVLEEAKRLMRKNRVQPDMIILWPTAQIYLTMAMAGRETLWYTVGEGQRLIQNRGPESLSVLRGLDVFETRDFDVYRDEPAVQLLSRSRTVGERYHMSMKDWRNLNYNPGKEGSRYETRWRDIYLYDENEDDYVKMHFEEAVKNSGLFDLSTGTYSRELANLVIKYNVQQRPAPSETYDPFARNDSGVQGYKTSNGDLYEPPHFLTRHNGKQWELIKFFGQMEKVWASDKDFLNIAAAIKDKANKVTFNSASGTSTIESALIDAKRLLHQIESEPYNEDYFNLLIEANKQASMDSNGKFKGIKTPSKLAKNWGGSTNEWVSNAFGGLNLPQDPHNKISHVQYPAAFNNWVGFKTIANEAYNPKSKWYHLGVRAKQIVEAIQDYADGLSNILPNSRTLNPDNRSPNFHKEDVATVFFENHVVGVQRDPLHLAFTLGNNSSSSSMNSTSSGDVDILQGGHSAVVLTKDGELILSKQNRGTTIKLDDRTSTGKLLLPLSIHAKMLMARDGDKISSEQAFDNLMDELSSEDQRRLVTLTFTLASRKKIANPIDDTRQVIRGLALYKGDKSMSLETLTTNAKQNAKEANQLLSSLKALVNDEEREPVATVHISEIIPNIPSKKSAEYKIANLLDEIISNARNEDISLDLTATNVDSALNNVDGSITLSNLLGEYIESKENTQSLNTLLSKIHTSINNSDFQRSSTFSSSNNQSQQYFRAPLTMSKTLLETAAIHRNPLIAPSDPRALYLKHFNIADSSLRRQISSRPQYEEITTLHKNPELTGLHTENSTIAKVFRAISGDSSLSNTNSAPSYGAYDEYEDSDDEFSNIFSTSKQKIGAPLTQEQQDKYNQQKDPSDLKDFLSKNTTSNNILQMIGEKDTTFADRYAVSDDPAYRAFLTQDCSNFETWKLMMDKNIPVPLNLILWRSDINHNMASAIVMKRGLETGANLYGHQNFELGNDVATKMIVGNFTFNSKAMVWNEKNVHIVEDIKPERYLGGHNTQYMKSPKDFHDESRNRNSVIVTAIPLAEVRHNRVMDLTGTLNFGNLRFANEEDAELFSYSTCELYVNIWQLHDYADRNKFNPITDNFFARMDRKNTVCLQGLQFNYNTNSNQYNRVILCKGHRGPNGDYPGAASVWNGGKQFLEPFQPRNYNLE